MLVSTLFVLSLLLISTQGSFVKLTFPDYTGPALDSYSGFVTVDATRGRALHYILIKAENNPSTAPLIIWYQGGPGCSGLIGLFLENGPFHVFPGPSGTQLKHADYSWTEFANVVWVEQPAFVGFSYSNSTADKNTGDVQAAADNYKFVQLFISSEFPEYAGRDLYFTGESYAGVYIPTLTRLVLSNPGPLFNQLKGILVGNPVFSCQGGFIGSTGPYFVENFNLLYWHGFVSYSNYYNWTVTHNCNDAKTAETPACQYILNLAIDQVGDIEQSKRDISQSPNTWPSLDPDDIFFSFCSGNASLDFATYAPPSQSQDCNNLDAMVTSYLNRADVQKAFGVTQAVNWQECSDLNYNIVGDSMNPYYEFFFTAKPSLKVLIYSGDLDILTVPFAYTLPCVFQLSSKITSAWQPWFVNGATAGYVEVYDKFTYATIKGAGHEAPEYQPLTSYNMIKRFIFSGSLNDPTVYSGSGYQWKRSLRQGDMLRKYGLSPSLWDQKK